MKMTYYASSSSTTHKAIYLHTTVTVQHDGKEKKKKLVCPSKAATLPNNAAHFTGIAYTDAVG